MLLISIENKLIRKSFKNQGVTMIRLKNLYVFLVLCCLNFLVIINLSYSFPSGCHNLFKIVKIDPRRPSIETLAKFLELNPSITQFQKHSDGWYPQKTSYLIPEINLNNIYHPSRALIQIISNSTTDTRPVFGNDIQDYISSLKDSNQQLFFSEDLQKLLDYTYILEQHSRGSMYALQNIYVYIADLLRQEIEVIKNNEELLPRILNLFPYFEKILSKRKHELNIIRNMIYNFPDVRPSFDIEIKHIEEFITLIYSKFLSPTSRFCSGVAVSHNALLTAAHCVLHMKSISFQDETGTEHESILIQYNDSYVDSSSVNSDLAVVKFPDNTFKDYLAVDLTVPRYLEKVTVIAFEDYGQTKRVGVLSMPFNNPNHMSTNACFKTIHGNSGAPLINSSGKVAALVSTKVTTKVPAYNTQIVETRYASLQYNKQFLRDTVKRNPGLVIEGLD